MALGTRKARLPKPVKAVLCTGLCAGLLCSFASGLPAHAAELRGGFAASLTAPHNYDIATVKSELYPLLRSPELIVEIDKIIDSLDGAAPKMFRVQLDLYKLDSLAKIGEPSTAAEHAAKIYADHPRESFPSDVEYGDTMYQIVESLAKTDNLGISYDIIQKLRFGLYDNPKNNYLNFIIKKSLIEVHIETSDYQRALNLALSVMNDPVFKDIQEINDWRPDAINEIAYLYNKLGDGENALIYLNEAAKALEAKDPSDKAVKKARALNFANRGRAYLLSGDFNQARKMGKKVQEANKALNQTYLTAVSHRIIGCADFLAGNYQSAAEHLKMGIGLAKNDNNLGLKRILFLEYAMTLEKLGQHQGSALWYKELYELETKRQDAISATRSKLNDIEVSALKNHQEMVHLHHELNHSQSINKFMLIAIFSLCLFGLFLSWLLRNLRKSQKKLRKSEMEAHVANQAKSDFLANMSHEIRTPMNGVLGMAQVLERTPLSRQQKTYLNIIKRSGNTLLELINDILDFSKIEADKLTLIYKDCDLDETIQDIVHLLMPNAQDRNIAIDYKYDPDFPKYLVLDTKRVRQIVMNLIGNAVKFTKQGSVTIEVGGSVSGNIAQITISVTDTGIGIHSEQLETIFEKFTQAQKSSEAYYSGTGLGLAISSKLTQAMNGELSVTSSLGEGSIFTLTLPAQIAASAAKSQDDGALISSIYRAA